MQPERLGLTDVSLIEGERIESALDLAGDGKTPSKTPEYLLLTDHRIIHIRGNGKRRKAQFASIRDVEVVETDVRSEGPGAYVWAALAIVVAIFLFFVIDHTIGRVVVALAVASLGVYLIVDHLTSPGRPLLMVRTGSSELRFDIRPERLSGQLDAFINLLFELKRRDGFRVRPFSLR